MLLFVMTGIPVPPFQGDHLLLVAGLRSNNSSRVASLTTGAASLLVIEAVVVLATTLPTKRLQYLHREQLLNL